LQVSLITRMYDIRVHCAASEPNLSTLPLTYTRMNKMILLPVTGHCTCYPGAAETTAGFQVHVDKKCQIAHQKMPNSFKKCQTSWNRPMAVSFEL